jgi:hypothetical protein
MKIVRATLCNVGKEACNLAIGDIQSISMAIHLECPIDRPLAPTSGMEPLKERRFTT